MVSVINLQHLLICLSNWLDERGEESKHVKGCENNLRLPSIICRSFAANQRKFAVSVFRLHQTNRLRKLGDMETWRHKHETWKHWIIETWRHGREDMDIKTWRQDMQLETWTGRHDDMAMDRKTWTRRHRHGDMDMRHGKETKTCRHGIKIWGILT